MYLPPISPRSTSLHEASFPVMYKTHRVGTYYADLLVEDTLVVEIKCVDRLAPEHMAQCLNYLRASGKELCLLVNFQRPKVEWKRIILSVYSRSSAARTPS